MSSVVLGRVWSGRFSTGLDYMVKRNIFRFISHTEKINRFQDIAFFASVNVARNYK